MLYSELVKMSIYTALEALDIPFSTHVREDGVVLFSVFSPTGETIVHRGSVTFVWDCLLDDMCPLCGHLMGLFENQRVGSRGDTIYTQRCTGCQKIQNLENQAAKKQEVLRRKLTKGDR